MPRSTDVAGMIQYAAPWQYSANLTKKCWGAAICKANRKNIKVFRLAHLIPSELSQTLVAQTY